MGKTNLAWYNLFQPHDDIGKDVGVEFQTPVEKHFTVSITVQQRLFPN